MATARTIIGYGVRIDHLEHNFHELEAKLKNKNCSIYFSGNSNERIDVVNGICLFYNPSLQVVFNDECCQTLNPNINQPNPRPKAEYEIKKALIEIGVDDRVLYDWYTVVTILN
jgi:hypothetical protein